MRITLNWKPGPWRYRLRRWLSDKLSQWSVRVHPSSEKSEAIGREFMNQALLDLTLYGTALVRVNPLETLKAEE